MFNKNKLNKKKELEEYKKISDLVDRAYDDIEEFIKEQKRANSSQLQKVKQSLK